MQSPTLILPYLQLRWLEPNRAWAFLFGDQVTTCQLIRMEHDGRPLFPTRGEAVSAAKDSGLAVAGDGRVTAITP